MRRAESPLGLVAIVYAEVLRASSPLGFARDKSDAPRMTPAFVRLLRFETGSDRNFGLEKLGNGATGFRSLDRGIEFGFVRTGDASDEIEMTLGDAEAVSDFFEGDGGGGFKFLRGETGIAELRGKRHGEAARVRGGEQLFGIGAHAVFKTGAERILCLFQRAAIGGNGALTAFQIALPDGARFALHARSPSLRCDEFDS